MSDADSMRNRRPLSGAALDGAPCGVRPGRTPLSGRHAALEPLDPRRHTDGLFEAGRDEGIWTYMPYGPFADAGAMRDWLRQAAGSADPLFFAVRERGSGRPAGMASFLEMRPAAGVAEIGHIWFGAAFQNRPVTTEALYLMMRHVLDELGYRRLEWKCNALNEDSRRAARRLGFRHEGVFLNHMVVKGRNRDTAWYSLIDSEWPPVRANFERWLEPANFDAEGVQKRSLGAMNAELW